jgi:hypothetical protein
MHNQERSDNRKQATRRFVPGVTRSQNQQIAGLWVGFGAEYAPGA